MAIKDPEKRRAYMRAYYAKNVEKLRPYNCEKRRNYVAAHREELNAKQRARRAAFSPEKKAELSRLHAEYYQKHKTKLDRACREWQKKHPERVHELNRRSNLRRYARELNTTLEFLESTHAARKSRCEICGRKCELRLDHDHATNTFRGWLCNSCNRGLGYLRDDVKVCRAATQYLEKRHGK